MAGLKKVEKFYKLQDVARILGVSYPQLYERLKFGKVASRVELYRISTETGGLGRLRIPESSVNKLLKEYGEEKMLRTNIEQKDEYTLVEVGAILDLSRSSFYNNAGHLAEEVGFEKVPTPVFTRHELRRYFGHEVVPWGDGRETFNLPEAARLTGVPPGRLVSLMNDGNLKTLSRANIYQQVVPREQLLSWLESRRGAHDTGLAYARDKARKREYDHRVRGLKKGPRSASV